MSKTVLIVICDFLLLSLLSLANFDSPSNADKNQQDKEQEELVLEQSFADSQMIDLLKVSLDNERLRREQLNDDISKLAKSEQEQKQLAQQNQQLAQQNQQILSDKEKELLALNKAKQQLESQKLDALNKAKDIESKFAVTQSQNLEMQKEILQSSAKLQQSSKTQIELQKQLSDIKQSDSASRLKLESMQEELRLSKEKLAKLESERKSLEDLNQNIEKQKQDLTTKLEVASTKTQIYEKDIQRYQSLVSQEKDEKAKIRQHAETLAVGVGQLAEKQATLTKEITTTQKAITKEVKELRPQTSSEIFANLKDNLVTVAINYTSTSLLGDSQKVENIKTVPVSIDGKIWLIFSAKNTILAPVEKQYYPKKEVSISVNGKSFKFSPKKIYALAQDPRLLTIPVPETFVEKENIKPLSNPENFFAFTDCVVINTADSFYGQVPFRADFDNTNYAQLDVSIMQSIFGTFSPSSGDMILSRSSNYMGLMIDGSTGVLLKNITLLEALPLAESYSEQAAKVFVMQISTRLKNLPYKLR